MGTYFYGEGSREERGQEGGKKVEREGGDGKKGKEGGIEREREWRCPHL